MRPFYEELIDKILSQAKFLSKLGIKLSTEKTLHFHPFITISREPGSGGKPIADLVAKKLNFEVYDEKLVEEIAKSSKKRTELIRSVDEKARSLITDVVQSIINPDYISDVTYIRHVARVVLNLGHIGKVIIMDRGANFLIPSDAALRVRIQAPYKVRVERAIKYEGVNREKAAEIIREVDTERKQFIRQYYNKNISNANYYDMVLNTTHMTIEDAASLVIDAFEKKFRL